MKLELNQARESRDWLKADKKRLEKEIATKNEWIKTQEEVLLPSTLHTHVAGVIELPYI